jgi:hypothetical protein
MRTTEFGEVFGIGYVYLYFERRFEETCLYISFFNSVEKSMVYKKVPFFNTLIGIITYFSAFYQLNSFNCSSALLLII